MHYQKTIAFILALITIFTLSACNDSNGTADVSRIPIVSGAYNGNGTPSATPEYPEDDAQLKSNSSTASSIKTNSTSSKNTSVATTSKKESSQSATNKVSDGPKLYKVTDSKGNIAWLFGSIPIGRKSFYPLPHYITDALLGADVLAVETDIVAFENDKNAREAAKAKLYTTDTHIRNFYAPFMSAEKILEDNSMYSTTLDNYLPPLWSMMIDELTYKKLGIKSEYAVDRHIINKAKQKKIKIAEIEPPEAKYKSLAELPIEIQVSMLGDSVERYETNDSEKELSILMDIWEKGDYDTLRQTMSEEAEESYRISPDRYHKYNDINIRNDGLITDYIISALASGKENFVCVDMEHLARKFGVMDSLKSSGYTVEEIN